MASTNEDHVGGIRDSCLTTVNAKRRGLRQVGRFVRLCTCFGIVLFLMLGTHARAEDSEWLVRNWHIEDGLPDSRVTALQQTADGYLWVGTPHGLARFDGVHFKVFAQELGNGSIRALLASRSGALWIASGASRLLCYESGRFRAIETQDPAAGLTKDEKDWSPSPLGNAMASLAEDAVGGIWFLQDDGGLLRWHDGKVTRHTTATGLPPGKPAGLCSDDTGQVWLFVGGKLFRWSDGTWLGAEQAELSADPPTMFTAARPGGFWAAGARREGGRLIRRFDRAGQAIEELAPTPWVADSMRKEVTTLLADHANRVWIGTLWNGIWYSESSGEWRRVESGNTHTESAITCLYEDRQGVVWAGTDRSGLSAISRRPVSMLRLPTLARDSIVNTSCAARDGSVWMGTDGAGVFRYRDGRFEHFGNEQGLDNPHVISVFEDRHADLWLGTWGELFKFEQGRFQRVNGPPELGGLVLALFEDRAGKLWVGTSKGLVCHKDGVWTVQRLLENNIPIDIRALAEDAAGNLWVGTTDQGLFRLKDGQVTRFPQRGDFPGDDASSLFCDPDGALWIGTNGEGLIRFQDGRFTQYTRADGLPCDTICSIALDDDGNLWVGSDNGIFSCPLGVLKSYQKGSSHKLLCRHLGLAEGMGSRACSGGGQPKHCRASDGRFWFPNMRGLAVFDPRTIPVHTPPKVLIESITIDGVETVPKDEMRATSSARRFEFHFTAPELVSPQSLRFRYKLEGMDHDWVDAGNQRVATYSQLPHGSYQFRIMAGGEDGQWHESAVPLPLRVVPRFWELQWVQLLASILLVGVTAGFILLNERRIHRRRLARLKQARALEQERQRIASNIHDDLGASLTRITLLSEITRERAIAGGIGAEMEQIHDTSRNLTRAMGEVVWAIAPEHDTLDSLVNYLGKLAQDLLSAAGVSCRLDFPAILPEIVLSGQVRHSLLLAAKEALHNVVKHSTARVARVRVSLQDETLELVVSDDGRGFDSAGKVSTSPPGGGRISSGRGLRNMAMRLKDLGGQCEIFSHPGTGTEVKFRLPLGTAEGDRKPQPGHLN